MINGRMRSIYASLLGSGLTLGLGLIDATADAAQATTGTIRVEVVAEGAPVAGATVAAGGESAATDASGTATLALPPGQISVIATKDGYESATARVDVVAGGERAVRLVLIAKAAEQDQATVVASTRTGLRIDDQAVPIEVLGRDRIEENMLMSPGNIVRSLDEMSCAARPNHIAGAGPRDATHPRPARPVHAAALRRRALYFDLPGGLAPVQIPPMDLDRIEVIAGGASALFGANALAGVGQPAVAPAGKGAGPRVPVQPVRAGRDGCRAVALIAADRIVEQHVSRRRAPAGRTRRGRRRLVGHCRLPAWGRAPACVLGQPTREVGLRHGGRDV